MKVKHLSFDSSTGRLVATLADDEGHRLQLDYIGIDKTRSLYKHLFDGREADLNFNFEVEMIPKKKGKKKFTDMSGQAECHGGVKS